MSESVKDKKDSRGIVGLVFVWLIIAGMVVAILVLSYSIVVIFSLPLVGLVVGGLTGFFMVKMIRHILWLSKQPE